MKGNEILARLTGWLDRRRFLREVLTVAGGTAAAQAVLILASPVLTRLYPPAEFGMLAVFASMLTILLAAASLRFDLAIPLPREDRQAADLLAVCLLLAAAVSLLSGLLVWLAGNRICDWLGAPSLVRYLPWLPLGLFGASLVQALGAWVSRKRIFAALSWSKGMQSAGQVVIQVVGGFMGTGIIGLLTGYIASQFLGLGTLIRKSAVPFSSVTWRGCSEAVRAYQGFPIYTLWASLVVVAGVQLPPILFARYFSLDVSGYFSLAMRVLGLPTVLIGAAVGQVFYPTVAGRTNEGVHPGPLFVRTANVLFVLGFAIFGFVGIHGPEVFAMVFGEKWRAAGLYAQFLAPWLMVSFVSSPLSTYPFVAGAFKESFAFSAVVTLLRVLSIWVGGRLHSPELALMLFTGSGVVMCLLYFAWMLRLVDSNLAAWTGSFGKTIGALAAIVAGLVLARLHLPSTVSVALSLVVLIGASAVILRKMDRSEPHD